MSTTSIPATPALLIDEVIVDRNLARMANYCASHSLKLRPHTKTHKSVTMAKKQLDLGAVGLTVAKVGEAESLASIETDFLVGYPPIDAQQSQRLIELARRFPVRVAVDSVLSVDVVAALAQAAGVAIGVLVDLDVGFHRTGVQTPAEALELARYISKSRGVTLDGLFTFPGHASMSPDTQAGPLALISAILRETIAVWKQDGHVAKIVSGGSTPTAMQAHYVPEWTEIRPGTYIYCDRNCIAGGWATIEDCAATVVTTVVSNAVPNKCVIDAGSKSLTSDRLAKDPMHGGFGLVVEYPAAKIVRLSEEHGELDLSACDKRPALGERIHVIPNHICPCVNLFDRFWLKHTDGVLEQMTVDGRGKVW